MMWYWVGLVVIGYGCSVRNALVEAGCGEPCDCNSERLRVFGNFGTGSRHYTEPGVRVVAET